MECVKTPMGEEQVIAEKTVRLIKNK